MVKLLLECWPTASAWEAGILVLQRENEGQSVIRRWEFSRGLLSGESLCREADVWRATADLRTAALPWMWQGRGGRLAADLEMHGLPDEEAKAMASRMRDTWPADPPPPSGGPCGGRGAVRRTSGAA